MNATPMHDYGLKLAVYSVPSARGYKTQLRENKEQQICEGGEIFWRDNILNFYTIPPSRSPPQEAFWGPWEQQGGVKFPLYFLWAGLQSAIYFSGPDGNKRGGEQFGGGYVNLMREMKQFSQCSNCCDLAKPFPNRF